MFALFWMFVISSHGNLCTFHRSSKTVCASIAFAVLLLVVLLVVKAVDTGRTVI